MPSAAIDLAKLPEWREIGRHLGRARRQAGLTQKGLADRCKLRQGEISAFESGRRFPTLAQLTELARALDVPLQWFISGTVTPPEDDLSQLSTELRHWGVYDLSTEGAVVPGAFRPLEQLLPLALRGDGINRKLLESMPYVLAINVWRSTRLLAHGRQVGDPRVLLRLGWLADVTKALYRAGQLPEAEGRRGALAAMIKKTKGQKSQKPESLGHPATDWSSVPSVYKRWNVSYAGSLDHFRQRTEHLRKLRPVREG
jgi:transcriptional regulator with XRE-family HTH domain